MQERAAIQRLEPTLQCSREACKRREKRGQRSRKNEGETLQECKMLEHVLKKTQSTAWMGGVKVQNVARKG